jgi:hypothetical protein
MNVIENEFHFLCECPGYELDRQSLYTDIINRNSDFENLLDADKFCYILKYEWKRLTKYLQNAWRIRSEILYR